MQKPVPPSEVAQVLARQLERWHLVNYENGHALSQETELLRPVTAEMALLCSGRPAYLDQLTPRRFEELIASLFRNHGFKVELTARTRDGGYDIVAVSS